MGLVLVGAVTLMALSEPSYPEGALDSAKKRPSQAVGEKILLLLSDKGKSDTQKAAELARIRGSLSPQATAPLLDLLRKSDGVVFLALALCLERCGAGKGALSVAEAIVSDKSTPASQFAAALRFIQLAAFTEDRLTAPLENREQCTRRTAAQAVKHGRTTHPAPRG